MHFNLLFIDSKVALSLQSLNDIFTSCSVLLTSDYQHVRRTDYGGNRTQSKSACVGVLVLQILSLKDEKLIKYQI